MKAITADRINGPVFLVGALEDMLGNSVGSVEDVVAQLKAQHRSDYVALVYDAGHSIGLGIPNIPSATIVNSRYGWLDLGGSPAQAAHTRADSWPKLLAFLRGCASASA